MAPASLPGAPAPPRAGRASMEAAAAAGAASWLRADAAVAITAGSGSGGGADAVAAAAYTPHDAQQFSPHGVALPAIALARRAALHSFAAAAEAAALLPLHVLSLLPLRAPLLASATAVLSGGSVALDPMAMGLVAVDAPAAAAAPGQQQTAAEAASAAADAALSSYLASSLGPQTDAWAPLGLLLAQGAAIPAVGSERLGDPGDDVLLLGLPAHSQGAGPADLIPASLRAVADATAAPALDAELGLLLACAGGLVDAPGLAAGHLAAPADSRWDVAVSAAAAVESEGGRVMTARRGSAAGFPSHPLDPLRCDIIAAAAAPPPPAPAPPPPASAWLRATVWAEVGTLVASPDDSPAAAAHALNAGRVGGGAAGGGGAVSLWAACAEPATRSAAACVAVVAAIVPFLQLGQADAFVGALAAPLRPASAAAAQEAVAAGGSSRARLAALTDHERLVAARNVAAALGALLASLLPEHVRAAGGDGDLPQWALTARGVLGTGVCSRDSPTRVACALGLSELVRLGGAGFGRRLVAAMEKQVQKCAAEAGAAAAQERAATGGKGGAGAVVGGGSAAALLLGVGRGATAGLVHALARVKRECDRSALAAWTTGGVAQVRAAGRYSTDSLPFHTRAPLLLASGAPRRRRRPRLLPAPAPARPAGPRRRR